MATTHVTMRRRPEDDENISKLQRLLGTEDVTVVLRLGLAVLLERAQSLSRVHGRRGMKAHFAKELEPLRRHARETRGRMPAR
jgi:hypothetical protein